MKNGITSNLIKINSCFSLELIQLCEKIEVPLIQVGTDCVFSGKRGEYLEDDDHDETGAYGISKSLGEPSSCTVIRTSIIGRELYNKKSFLEWVLSNDGKTINGYENHIWNGITCLEWSKLIEKIINQNDFWKGTKHFISPTQTSKYDLVKMISNQNS